MGINNPLSAIGFRLPAGGLTALDFQLLASGSRLSAFGYRLSASGFRRAFGNPPSPLRGPLPPDKQWGAREYIGARHLPLDRGGQGRSADFRLLAGGFRLPVAGFRLSVPDFPIPGPQSLIPNPDDSFFEVLFSKLIQNVTI